MKALMAVTPGEIALGELDVPAPGEFEALVKMEACAICNSTDVKLAHNEFVPGTFPVVLGHEVISTVVEVGAKVKNFKPGDRVFRQRLRDEHVPGEGRSCWGGFAQYGLVADEWARRDVPYGPDPLPHDQQKLLPDVEPALATAMVTLMECLDCIGACGAAPDVSVAVVGSGPVGQALAMFAKLLGAAPVYGFGRRDVHAERFETVCGVDGYVAGGEFPEEVSRIVEGGGFDLVVEGVGSADAMDACLRLAGEKGKVCVYGIAPQSEPWKPHQMERDNVERVGAKEGRAQPQLVEFVQAGKVDLSDWITHRRPLSEGPSGFADVESKQATKLVLLNDE